MTFDPRTTYVHLDADGTATEVAGGNQFWSLPAAELARFGRGWLVSEQFYEADWPSWERHPEADELVYLISGSVDFILDEPAGARRLELRGSAAVVVPRSVWHTAKVHAPSRLLFVTLGEGTTNRPA